MLQTSLFEEDYLLRELGQLAHTPQVALTELVANAWDAGASNVDITIPDERGGELTIIDDGHGMTKDQFKQRWMTLRYDRLRHQGADVQFPTGRKATARIAYGRNGVGRHGLLCFADEYAVSTWCDGDLAQFVVGTSSGSSPFVLRSESFSVRDGAGTRLSVKVERNLPDPEEILTVLSVRFVHDPEFVIRVNGTQLQFSEIEGRVSEETLDLGEGRSARVIVIDSTKLNQSSIHQGVAFWVQKRLVGTISWTIGKFAIDRRTRFARRYTVIVDTSGFESDVEEDWTGFRSTDSVDELYKATADHVCKIMMELAGEFVESVSEDALSENRNELASLGLGAQLEVSEFTRGIATAHPAISPDFLATAVKAVINLEKSKSGAALLQKLSTLESDDIDGLDHLLSEWTVKDALRALDEIDSRISVIETIQRLADDPDVDELHTLHPLVLRSRWLFGHEFESQEYCSNATLRTVSRELFKKSKATFINDNTRPDIVVLPEKTSVQITGVEVFDPVDPVLAQLQNILLIELKRGGFKLTRKEAHQAENYVQDISLLGLVSGKPYINAWVVGQMVDNKVPRDKKLSDDSGKDYGRVRATTFSTLVDTANLRLFRMKELLSEKYNLETTDELLSRVLSKPRQGKLDAR